MAAAVLFLPDYGDANPYQMQLREGLAAHGVSVSMASGAGLFPVVTAVARHGWPAVVHLHWLHPYLVGRGPLTTAVKGIRLVVELLVLRLIGVTVVWTVHNLFEHDRRAPRVEAAFKHVVLRVIDAGIVHCPAARTSVQEAYRLPSRIGAKLSVVPHGHYIDWYENERTRREARRELGLALDSTVFLHFGRIERYKGVSGLVAGFRSLADDDARLLLVGRLGDDVSTDDLGGIETEPRIRTRFEYVPDDAVQTYMNAADAVVLPYQNVLTSGTAVLAASFGRAVIAPDRGCVADRLAAGDGLLFDPDTDRIARVLARSTELDLDRIGARNRALIRTPSWRTIGRDTKAVYGGESDGSGAVAE